MHCIYHLVNMKLGSHTFKALQKIGDKIIFPGLAKNGYRLNKNLSWETIFLATTLCKSIKLQNL